ncbi:hypothetical protein VULLAG_LOCUS21660 [Vulpes lagopus]
MELWKNSAFPFRSVHPRDCESEVRLMQSTEDLNSSKRLNKKELFLPESLSQNIHLLLPSNCYVHQPSWFSSLPTSQPPSPRGEKNE